MTSSLHTRWNARKSRDRRTTPKQYAAMRAFRPITMHISGTDAGCRRNERIFFFQAEDGIRDLIVTGVQTCALPILFRGPGELSWACFLFWRLVGQRLLFPDRPY